MPRMFTQGGLMTTLNAGAPPTVVFISQLGTGGDSWKPVIEALTCGAATVTYDRPGTGSAPPRPAPNGPLPYSGFAAELESLLAEEGVTGPLVIVGHSFGGLIARAFADQYPGRVHGAVLVDGSIPRRSLWPAYPTVDDHPDGDGPNATWIDTLAGEIQMLGAFVPKVPAAVITRTPGRWTGDYPAERCDPLWMAYQQQLARQWRTPLVVAEDAGHQVPAEAPRLVAFLIDHVVRCARQRGGSQVPDVPSLAVAGGRFDGTFDPGSGMLSTPHGRAWARKTLEAAEGRRTPEDPNAMRQRLGLPPRSEPREPA